MTYYESFKQIWINIYKKQYFKAKLQNDMNALLEIKENIWKNIHFDKQQKNEFWKLIGGVE